MSTRRFRTYSQRRGLAQPFKMHDGVPPHLKGLLLTWVDDHLWGNRFHEYDYEVVTQLLIVELEIPFSSGGHQHAVGAIYAHVKASDNQFLDVLDFLVHEESAGELEVLLRQGGSVHCVVEDDSAPFGYRLDARVSNESRATYESAIAAGDEVAEDLSEAWRKAFGRDPDPADAWQHAVRAVEGALHRIVLRKAERAQMGRIIKAIEDKPEKWAFVLSEGDGGGDGSALLPTLRLIGYDPGRHPGGEVQPSLDQAKAVVVLAATVVEWVRQGAFAEVAE